MNPLVIKLTGTIDSSNFDEWKRDLIAQIQSVNRALVSDADFATAAQQVKAFKVAESVLKQAKQSAIDQADEIQRLFSAIDEVSGESRQARLALEHQIKARKLEIRNELIQAGIDNVRGFVDQQLAEFRGIDTSRFVDRSRFESVSKGKAGIRGLQAAIDGLCAVIRAEVSDKAFMLGINKEKLAVLPDSYEVLFQDAATLIDRDENELELEIEKRIARYNEQRLSQEAKQKTAELERIEALELNPEKERPEDVGAAEHKEKFHIVIELLASREEAIEVAKSVKERYGEAPLVGDIRLVRNREP